MDWPTASVILTAILGVSGAVAVAIIKLVPERRGRSMEMKPEQHASLEQKLDRLQEDVGEIESAVKVLENNTARSDRDINGLRTQIEGMRNEMAALKDMLVKHILNLGKS